MGTVTTAYPKADIQDAAPAPALSDEQIAAAVDVLIDELTTNNPSAWSDLVFEFEEETDTEVEPALQLKRGGEMEDEDFAPWVRAKLRERVTDAAAGLLAMFKDGQIQAWRAVAAPADWDHGAGHPGIYWSWTEDGAQPYLEDGDADSVTWVLEGRIPFESVDWDTTLRQNCIELYESETEITLLEGAPVEVVEALVRSPEMSVGTATI
jgi:hypothetical protein